MRVVDVDARPGRAFAPAAEAWVLGEPGLDAQPLDAPAGGTAGERPVPVLVPGAVAAIRGRLASWADAGSPRVARIHPGAAGHGYPLADWLLPPLPEVLDRDGWALAVDPGPARPWPWEGVVALARRYPGLPVLGIGAPLDDRAAGPALDATANLVLAVTGPLDERTEAVVRGLVGTAGAHRLCLGSGGRVIPAPAPAGLPDGAVAALLAGTADALGDGTWREAWL